VISRNGAAHEQPTPHCCRCCLSHRRPGRIRLHGNLPCKPACRAGRRSIIWGPLRLSLRAPLSQSGGRYRLGARLRLSCSGWQFPLEFSRSFEKRCRPWGCWIRHEVISPNWLPILSASAFLGDSLWACLALFDLTNRSANSASLERCLLGASRERLAGSYLAIGQVAGTSR
jgi:hypothetical protein